MSHQVIWTKRTTDLFIELGGLTTFQADLLRTRISGMTRVQQSFYFNVSISTVDKVIARLKRKYDACVAEYPDDFKPRKNSIYQEYMDSH